MGSHGIPAQTSRKQQFSSVPRDLLVSGTQRCVMDAWEVLFFQGTASRSFFIDHCALYSSSSVEWQEKALPAVLRIDGPFSNSSGTGIEEMAQGPPCAQAFSLSTNCASADFTNGFCFSQRARPWHRKDPGHAQPKPALFRILITQEALALFRTLLVSG